MCAVKREGGSILRSARGPDVIRALRIALLSRAAATVASWLLRLPLDDVARRVYDGMPARASPKRGTRDFRV